MDPEAFLKVSAQYRLGDLVTEQPHPETVALAELAQSDLHAAIAAFHRVDLMALERLAAFLDPLPDMVRSMKETVDTGGRIFLAGCGATGRLSLALEALAREAWLPHSGDGALYGFMAGGDAALIRSIESFEDYPAYGARQLREPDFGENDLLIAITEGGETPFVIGACMEAAERSRRPPWFLFCNPPALLRRVAERSRAVLDHPGIRAWPMEIGPMALAGSTRLQAATVQMLVTGAALAEAFGHGPAPDLVARFRDLVEAQDPAWLAPFIEAEARIYAGDDLVLYQTDHYGITVLTDTTERSPTFSLPPFENRHDPDQPGSPCYLSLPECRNPREAWARVLQREPRALDWKGLAGRAGFAYLLGHDISCQAAEWRSARFPGKRQYPYLIHGVGPTLGFAGLEYNLGLAGEPLLLRHLLLKCRLNLQSTLVMGRLGRFTSNLMTCVAPGNYKLIDRAARYRQHRHRQQTGETLPYPDAVREVFHEIG